MLAFGFGVWVSSVGDINARSSVKANNIVSWIVQYMYM